MLLWDDTYAIARALLIAYPGVDLAAISLDGVYHRVISLPDFSDETELANDEILQAIYQEWFEEANPL